MTPDDATERPDHDTAFTQSYTTNFGASQSVWYRPVEYTGGGYRRNVAAVNAHAALHPQEGT